jgi:hypothetical protein
MPKIWGVPAFIAALSSAGLICAHANEHTDRSREQGGFVTPCSLDGVNPSYHPEIFGNPASAAQYGFIQGPGGVWQVRASCRH